MTWRALARIRMPLVCLMIAACHDQVAAPPPASTAPRVDRVASLSAVSNQELTATVGAAVPTPPTVIVRDADGNPVAGAAVVFSGAYTAIVPSAADGTASTPWVLPTKPGSYELIASAGNAPPIRFHAVANVGRAASIDVRTPRDQVISIGTTSAGRPTVVVTDYVANPVAGVEVRFEVGGSGGKVENNTAITNFDGVATAGDWNVGTDAGLYTLGISIAGISSPLILAARVYGPLLASSVAAGAYASCANTLTGATYCWGNRAPTPTPMQSDLHFASLTVGGGFACGLTVPGSEAYCWGRVFTDMSTANSLPSAASFVVPRKIGGGVVFSALTAGDSFACGLDRSGRAYCWGDNTLGQLGDGTTRTRLEPTPVAGTLTFATISAGLQHACGVTRTSETFCWGVNDARQLGDTSSQTCDTSWFDDYDNVTVPAFTKCSPTPQRVSGIPAAVAVSAGVGSCSLATDGIAFCWGFSSSPEAISRTVRFANILAMTYYNRERPSVETIMCGTTATGALFCRRTDSLDVTAVAPGFSFATIAAGTEHVCALDRSSSRVYCWGQNRDGQLGNGATDATATPLAVVWPMDR